MADVTSFFLASKAIINKVDHGWDWSYMTAVEWTSLLLIDGETNSAYIRKSWHLQQIRRGKYEILTFVEDKEWKNCKRKERAYCQSKRKEAYCESKAAMNKSLLSANWKINVLWVQQQPKVQKYKRSARADSLVMTKMYGEMARKRMQGKQSSAELHSPTQQRNVDQITRSFTMFPPLDHMASNAT